MDLLENSRPVVKEIESYYENAGYVNDVGHLDRITQVPENVTTKNAVGQSKKKDKSSIDNDTQADSRDTWDSPLEFLLSCISMSVGLGNIWRFPGVAAKNGGGAFLIPYLIVLLFIGRPLYYLEMCLGQFSRYGQVKVWNMAPLFKGVGYGSMTAVICVCSYYCSLMATTVYFFFSSFSKELPWAVCHQDKHPHINCSSTGIEASLAKLFYNSTVNPQLANINHGLGDLSWQLSLCLLFSWTLIFLSLMKGVKSSGKVAYFTAIFPYVVLIILLIRGVTLEGAWTGIKIFLEPEWSAIKNPNVWYAAVEQCILSLSTGFGAIIMFSSFNNFRHDVYRDALIISFMDTFTSFLAGITTFSVIGNLMEVNNLKFDEIEGGPGLAFVLYPRAIASFNWVPQIFAVLFFLMLFTIGIGSVASLVNGVVTIFCDQFPSWKRWLVTLGACIFGCFSGLTYCTQGGMLMLDLIDHYGVGLPIYILSILECFGVAYVYGLSNFCNDIEFMIGRRVGVYWRICWGIVIPVGLFANLTYYLITQPEFTYNGIEYPIIATVFGWLITGFILGLVPAWAIHTVVTRKGASLKDKFCLAASPTGAWGPQDPAIRKEWLEFREQKEKGRDSNENSLVL